jgi:hypothetical protein
MKRSRIMPDLLAHVLFAYAVATGISAYYDWITPPFVTAVMAGACIPDIQKVRLLVSSSEIEAILGVPFNWSGQMTLGGVGLSILVGVILIGPEYRVRGGIALAVGTLTHVLTDALLITPSGRTFAVLWPLFRFHPPTPGLYHSTDVWPTAAAGLTAIMVYIIVQK